ncbi:hypothetical protein AMS68_006718 [Peltaster fructicola]|uniref:Uncharacterized protein n=1 Tax=Peltaster fructicola TaxID=286661 RepID=A0A6H0Y2Q5_9PEZI|nr:hypothetical protein AMS68_006718 [Peltaster fructicola]
MAYDYSRTPGTFTAMLKALGGIGPPGGPLLYMLRSLTVTSSSAVVIGGAMAWLSQALYGVGALGFVFGSCIGFVASSIGYFLHCRRHSINALEQFPTLMQMHLMTNFRLAGFEKMRLGDAKELARFKEISDHL